MNPAFLEEMSWEMAEVYGAVSDQILVNLARYFPYYTADDQIPRSAFTYQAKMLAQMGQVNRETVRIIREGLADADNALQGVLEAAIMDSVKTAEPELYKAVKLGVFNPPSTPVLAPNQMRAFQLYYKQAADKLNLVNTVMLESTQQAYQATVSGIVAELNLPEAMNRVQIGLDTAAGETITGVSSWNTAVKHATDRMKDAGITGFIDHAGRHWSAEAYAAMDVRTTTFNTARAAVWETNQNFGNDLYLVSWHNGARPLCYDWQNKVISSTNVSRTVVDLDGNEIHVYAQMETSYGQPAGLFGINCGHYPNPFIPGVSKIHGEPQSKEENDRTYAESQEQRRLERKLREQKRDVEMLKAQNAPPEQIKAARAKCRETSQQIDDFCEQTGRTRHRDREAVYTKREFPAKDTYDASTFTRERQERQAEYFRNGGAQTGYSPIGPQPGRIPITPITPKQPTPATPTEPAPVTPTTAGEVAQQATQTQPQSVTIERAELDANNFPNDFNKKKTKVFVETVNATEGVDPDVVKLFNTMGAQVDGAGYPVTISYTEGGHSVGSYKTLSGDTVKITVKVPKLTDAEFLREEIGTTAHEWGHLFDHINGGDDLFSYTFDNHALPNAIKNARPMSEKVRKLIDDAVKNGIDAERLVMNAANKEIDALSAEISKAISEKDYSAWQTLSKKRDALWNKAAKEASKASRKAHNGASAIEDIYDAISGGKLRDKTKGMYGHGSKYYKNNPGGEDAATETLANYCNLALAYPDLFLLMAEEQPEIWEACGNIVKAMIGV